MSTTTPTIQTTVRNEADRAYLEKMGAELLEQEAYERYQENATADAWLEHQEAVKTREIAHARYLDVLIAEQARLARVA